MLPSLHPLREHQGVQKVQIHPETMETLRFTRRTDQNQARAHMHTFCHKMTHSVSFFTRKSSQAIKASVSLRRRGRIVLVRESKIHICSEIRIKVLWMCKQSYLGSRLSWHASGTIGSRTTL